MAYGTQAYCEAAAGGKEALLQLCDDAGNGFLNTANLDAAIATADRWIDSYAQRRYAVPFAAPSETIKRLSAEEAVYRLKLRRAPLLSDADREAHEDRKSWLEGLAMGRVSPGVDPSPPKSSAVVPDVIERSTDENVSRDALKGFW